MLDYFEETTDDKALSSGYERIIRLNEIVSSIKASDEIGVKYMNAYEERMHDMAKAMKIKNYPYDEIAELTGLSPKDIKAL